MKTTIDKNFAGLELKDGVYHYSGDLKIDGNASIYENLIIDGDLTATGNVSADKVIVNGNVSINENLDVELFCVLGDITVKGDIRTRRTSLCYGDLKAYNLVRDDFLYVGGNINIKGKKYTPSSF